MNENQIIQKEMERLKYYFCRQAFINQIITHYILTIKKSLSIL